MNLKFAVPAVLAVLAVVFLSGCMQFPLENTETISIYKFKKDASFEVISEVTGTLTSDADKWTDCQRQLDSGFDMLITFTQMAPDLNAEQKQQLEMLKKLKGRINANSRRTSRQTPESPL